MPYIPPEDRPLFDPGVNTLLSALHDYPEESRGGALNYIVTRLLLGLVPNPKYRYYRSFIGDLVCCLLEFYRRHVGPYEDEAIKRNGDVK